MTAPMGGAADDHVVTGRIQGDAGRAARATTSRGVELLARAGYVAKGIVYLAVGILSASAAWNAATGMGASSGGARSSRGALSEIAGEPWGEALLWGVAVGLVGYVAWRLVQAFLDPEDHGTDAKGIATRLALLVSAVLYGLLGFWVFRVLLGNGGGSTAQAGGATTGGTGAGAGTAGGSGGSNAQEWSATLLQQEWGAWVLGLFGVAVVGYGFVEIGKAWRGTWEKRLRHDLTGTTRRWASRVARAGLYSRGIVFFVIGGFLVYTAWTADPSQARGLEGALATLGSNPAGPWLMGLVAVGLAAYGAFQLVKAWYRRIGPVT